MKNRAIIILSILIFTTSCSNEMSDDQRSGLNGDKNNNIEEVQNSKEENNDSDFVLESEVNVFNTEWIGLNEDGINEEDFIATMDLNQAEIISTLLQTLTNEILQKQGEDPESVLRGDWYNDVKNSEHYIEVVNMAEQAEKPLYWIIYKSENQGLYEYICCMALDEIYGKDFAQENEFGWTTSKEFLKLITSDILGNIDD